MKIPLIPIPGVVILDPGAVISDPIHFRPLISDPIYLVTTLTYDLGPICMVSGTRDNPLPELPWPRQRLAYFFPKFNQPFILGTRARLGGGERQLAQPSFLPPPRQVRVPNVNGWLNFGKK